MTNIHLQLQRQILLADMAASLEISGQPQTKFAWIPN